MTYSFLQICHLHRRQRRFEPFVAALQAGAVDGLLQRVAGQDTEGVWNTGILCGLADSARDFVGDYVVMGSVAAEKAADADDGVVLASLGEGAGSGGNLKRSRYTHQTYVFATRVGAQQGVIRTLKEPLSYERVEARHNYGEALPAGTEATFDGRDWRLRRSFDLELFLVAGRS